MLMNSYFIVTYLFQIATLHDILFSVMSIKNLKLDNILQAIKKDKRWIILIVMFSFFIFLRFYQIDSKSIFMYDQVDSAWAAKRILVDHNFPLIGPANRLGSGLFVGPLYYYLISPFYFMTGLDPIAAPLFAGFTAILTFFTTFYITKKIFSFNTALIAIGIYTISAHGIAFDRVQWEINFIPIVSLLTFFSIYKIIKGNEKFSILLALALGFAFHTHLTIAIFLPLITLFSSAFFPKTKKMLIYSFFSFLMFLLFLLPIIIANFTIDNSLFHSSFSYANTTFHGLHLQRILQLKNDAFIEIGSFLFLPYLSELKLFLVPIFFIVYLKTARAQNKSSTESVLDKLAFCFLVFLWFVIPWLVLSTYAGEITNYYFSINFPIALFILAYLMEKLLYSKNRIILILCILFISYYSFLNLKTFFNSRAIGINLRREGVKDVIKKGGVIHFKEGNPEAYIYYVYSRFPFR